VGKTREVKVSDADRIAGSLSTCPGAPATRAGFGWSEWQPLKGVPALSPDVLAEIVDGGQSFRWHRIEVGGQIPLARCPRDKPAAQAVWQGTWADNIVRLRLNPSECVEWCAPIGLQSQVGAGLADYFATGRDFATLSDALPWRSDPHLARCLIAFSGLRILRQPFGETLLGFLCSATKQIVQIKQMVALLAQRHGTPVPAGSVALPVATMPATPPMVDFRRLPRWDELASIPEAELRGCLLGFRARYIARTARFLAAHPGWLDETEALPYPAAKARLCLLPGVGEKIADCVLLFGAGRLEAFPVDVWILKTMARRYALQGWNPAQLIQFGRAHFGPLAGLAQQYLFAWERRYGKSEPGAQEPTPVPARARNDRPRRIAGG
jgi:N-glycosylase/DNA lyase